MSRKAQWDLLVLWLARSAWLPFLFQLALCQGDIDQEGEHERPNVSVAASWEHRSYGDRDVIILLECPTGPTDPFGSVGLALPESHEWWLYPFIANAALLSFQEMAVLEPPAQWSGYNFHIVHVDTCQHDSWEQCSAIDAIRLLDSHIDLSIHHHPQAALMTMSWPQPLAQRLSVKRIPTLGFQSTDLSLDNKSEFPYFLRTSMSRASSARALVHLVHHYNYSHMLIWHGQGDLQVESSAIAVDLSQKFGITASRIDYAPGTNNPFPPSDDSPRGREWNVALQRALLNGAHVFLMLAEEGEDPGLELIVWLSLHGLVGSGYLWLINFPVTNFMRGIVTHLLWLFPQSPYAKYDFVDGIITTDDNSINAERFEAFADYIRALRQRTHILEPWIEEKVTSDLFPEYLWNQTTEQYPTNAYRLFDSVWAILLAINDLLLEGRGHSSPGVFNSSQLLSTLWASDYEGTGGQISFDQYGGLQGRIAVVQFQPPCEGGTRVPDVLATDAEIAFYTELEGLSVVEGTRHVFHNCSTFWPPNGILECEPGYVYHEQTGSCVACAPGTFAGNSTAASVECSLCARGTYSNSTASVQCLACRPGEYSAVVGATSCAVCRPGRFQGEPLQSSCSECLPGSMATSGGQSACAPCTTGRYTASSGALNCTSCEAHLPRSTTLQFGAATPEACLCDAGMYEAPDDDPAFAGRSCQLCPPGMICQSGTSVFNHTLVNGCADMNGCGSLPQISQPLLQPGFMSLPLDPLVVYKCAFEGHCPGGEPGSCGANRRKSAIACGECAEDAYPSGEGCHRCGETSWVFLALAAAIVIVVIVGSTFAINREMQNMSVGLLSMIVLVALMFTSLQVLTVFDRIAVPWGPPLDTVMDATRFVAVDIVSSRMSCSTGNEPLLNYLTNLFVQPAAALLLVATLLLQRYLVPSTHTTLRAELAHTLGTYLSILFIPFLNVLMEPWVCYAHPGDSGWSVYAAPSVLCYDSRAHTSMLFYALTVMMVIPIPFLCLCGSAILLYPRCARGAGATRQFLYATRFLFVRFTPECYYFQAVLLLRTVLICLVPVVFEDPWNQVLSLTIVLSAYAAIQQTLRPWRAPRCNVYDLMASLTLLFLLSIATMFVETPADTHALSVLACGALLALFGVMLAALILATYHRFVKRPLFDYFLCHSKAEGGAQARLLKMTMQQKRGTLSIFLDSDNLYNLDHLFHVVQMQVRHLVVYLTRSVLKRRWCAGEIVTALRCGLPRTCVHTSSFSAPSALELQNPEVYLDSAADCPLGDFDIESEHVAEAYLRLLEREGTTHVSLKESHECRSAAKRFEALAAAVLQYNATGLTGDRPPNVSEVFPGGVILSTSDDNEAEAAGAILMAMVADDMFRQTDRPLNMLSDFVGSPAAMTTAVRESSVVVLILCPSSLRCRLQLSVVCEVMSAAAFRYTGHAPAVIPVHTHGFTFPSAAEIRSSVDEAQDDFTATYGLEQATVMVQSLFKLISVSFPTHSSQKALRTQAKAVSDRVVAELGVAGRHRLSVSVGPQRSSRSSGRSNTTSIAGKSQSLPLPAGHTPDGGRSLRSSVVPTVSSGGSDGLHQQEELFTSHVAASDAASHVAASDAAWCRSLSDDFVPQQPPFQEVPSERKSVAGKIAALRLDESSAPSDEHEIPASSTRQLASLAFEAAEVAIGTGGDDFVKVMAGQDATFTYLPV